MGCGGSSESSEEGPSSSDDSLKGHTKQPSQGTISRQQEMKHLIAFLESPDKRTLDKVWTDFDRDSNGSIDRDEMHDLIYRLICVALVQQSGMSESDLPAKSDESTAGAIQKIYKVLMDHIDLNGDSVVNRTEFECFGDWLLANKDYLLDPDTLREKTLNYNGVHADDFAEAGLTEDNEDEDMVEDDIDPDKPL